MIDPWLHGVAQGKSCALLLVGTAPELRPSLGCLGARIGSKETVVSGRQSERAASIRQARDTPITGPIYRSLDPARHLRSRIVPIGRVAATGAVGTPAASRRCAVQ